MTLAAASFLAVSLWIVGSVAAAAFLWFFVVPAIGPLYARYKSWLQKKASGQ